MSLIQWLHATLHLLRLNHWTQSDRLTGRTAAQIRLHEEFLTLVEVLLDQVALSLDTSPHVRGNIGNQPGHEELDHEHDMLWREKARRRLYRLSGWFRAFLLPHQFISHLKDTRGRQRAERGNELANSLLKALCNS
ncbi:hypothetical protein EYF80_002801 [Liparis tanakae]|uniref:Uncharacterized protein n=1 Tax=Liparis tanakae TaxID=230148 RepID=A0A4Z2J9Z3_9TELE|nr:hypothetical protein EYF80_002801 [Liparis tanakae]